MFFRVLVLIVVFVETVHSVDEYYPLNDACLNCLCAVSSLTDGTCKPQGCKYDANLGLICGVYLMSEGYYKDCEFPGMHPNQTQICPEFGYMNCVNSISCAKSCINRYYSKYSSNCVQPGEGDSCMALTRLHFGGPYGCHQPYVDGHLFRMKTCLDAKK